MGRKLILAPSARRDLKNIVAEIAHDAPTRAIMFGDALLDKAEQAIDYPESGRIVPEFGWHDLRELIHSPIRIIYRIHPTKIEVVRFWHAARGHPRV